MWHNLKARRLGFLAFSPPSRDAELVSHRVGAAVLVRISAIGKTRFWALNSSFMSQIPKKARGLVFSVRLFSEITVKSRSVRKRWTKILASNLRFLGRQIDERTAVVQNWDRIEVRVPSNTPIVREAFLDLLGRTPGISNFSEVNVYPLGDLQNILELTLPIWSETLVGKTFCVRVKRIGNHDFSSGDVERYVGAGLIEHIDTAGVNLSRPDVKVHLEIKDDLLYILSCKHEGLGGFPVGTQEPVLSLISGGFDSTVASFRMIQRGMRTHFCFFNLGGRAHELGVKEIAYYLWQRYAASHRVKFISVPFEPVVSEILTKVSEGNRGVVLKRMMLRAAERIAARGGVQALVTGEAVSQVSSQTIHNLALINQASAALVLRPLISMDKPDIIRQAREIGAEGLCANVPEYCGVISSKPSAKVEADTLTEDERHFDFAVLDEAVTNAQHQRIDLIMENEAAIQSVEKVSALPLNGVVVDIRHPEEQALLPLQTEQNNQMLSIPFYRLTTSFPDLDRAKHYFLYCDRGVMSELHASHLRDAGFQNVDVYRPSRGSVDDLR